MLVIKEIIGNAMIIFFAIIFSIEVLSSLSDFVKKYKNMKRQAIKYQKMLKEVN